MALCVESMIQNGPKGEKVSRQESYKDLNYDQQLLPFFKNNGYSKTLCEWSTDLIGPKQEKKYVQDKDVKKDSLWPSPHTKISV